MLKSYIWWTSSIASVLQTTQRFARKTPAVLITILKYLNILITLFTFTSKPPCVGLENNL